MPEILVPQPGFELRTLFIYREQPIGRSRMTQATREQYSYCSDTVDQSVGTLIEIGRSASDRDGHRR
jgi:hypothetical protein